MRIDDQSRRCFFGQMATLGMGVGAILQPIRGAGAQENRASGAAGSAPASRPGLERKPIGNPEIPLEVLFLGTGSPGIVASEARGGACEIVFVHGEPLLFDLGHLALHNLTVAGIHPNDIRHLFFTHTYHYDHFCDFGGFAQIRALRRQPEPRRIPAAARAEGAGPLQVYGPADTAERIDLLLRQVYAEDIRAQNLLRNNGVQTHVADEGMALEGADWRVLSTHVRHGPNALGFRIDVISKDGAVEKSVAITGDVAAPAEDGSGRITGFPCESIERLAKGVDLFIMDACGKHSSPEELAAAAVRANPRKVALTHVQDTQSGRVYQEAMRKVFQGEVIVAENQMRSVV